jgi:hypothetical protein
MSKARIMGAGLAGATRKGDGANVNQIQFGNKLQGLPPTTGKSTNFNLRAIKNRAWGNKRNVVFCMNQLGGIGGVRGSRMFLPRADGVGKCVPGEYLGPTPEPEPEPATSMIITMTSPINMETPVNPPAGVQIDFSGNNITLSGIDTNGDSYSYVSTDANPIIGQSFLPIFWGGGDPTITLVTIDSGTGSVQSIPVTGEIIWRAGPYPFNPIPNLFIGFEDNTTAQQFIDDWLSLFQSGRSIVININS